MRSFSKQFLKLVDKLPGSAASIECLNELTQHLTDDKVFTTNQLFDILNPNSSREFARLLTELAGAGIVRSEITVSSASDEVIGQYSTIEDVPDQLFDPTLEEYVEVGQDAISLRYWLHPNSSS